MASALNLFLPSDIDELAQTIAQAAGDGTRLEIRGGGGKIDLGAPRRNADILAMGMFSGVIDYDPAELVLTAGAATPLHEIEALLAENQQMLAFEPFDHGPLFGRAPGDTSRYAATLGGVIGAGVAGSRRLTAGGVRDHLLGFKGVSGRGEAFIAGGKVVKNVTGFDLSKLVCGSWGRLVALTEVTFKVLPRPREQITMMLEGLDPVQAVRVMSRAMGSQAEVSAAAYAPAGTLCGPSVTSLRLEGFEPSIAARQTMLETLLGAEDLSFNLSSRRDDETFWNVMRALGPLAGERPLWRIVMPPSGAGGVCTLASRVEAAWLMDWAGGLIWLASDAEPALIRQTAEAAGGHAMLVRGPEGLRRRIPALHPQPAGVRALEARVRRAFDPSGVFETGRFLDAADAD